MAIDFEVFEGKSLSDVFKDIYDNSKRNKEQLEVLMKEVVGFIKDGDTAVQIIPMLKEYLEINVKNDEQLVKLATIVQRLATAAKQGDSDEEFGLSEIRKRRGDLLSGGERRRTEIARALATNPNFILLDEPFAGVDPLAVEDIQKIVRDLTKKNIGILITDHNVQETLAITDRTYLMFEGKILRHGSPEDLANDEMVRKVYLGKNFELRKKLPRSFSVKSKN